MKTLVVKDSVISVEKDTVLVDIVNAFQHSANQQCFTVHTIAEPKEWYEYAAIALAIIGGVISVIYTFIQLNKLKNNDKDTQEQMNKLGGIVNAIEAQNAIINEGNELTRQNIEEIQKLILTGIGTGSLAEIEQKRFRLSVKPRLYIGASGYSDLGNKINIHFFNRGELCYYDGYDIIEGDDVKFNHFNSAYEINKDDEFILRGELLIKPVKTIKFKMKIKYHDQAKYKYETIIEWDKFAKIIDTNEL
jgi:hypothetical protein